MFCTEINLYLGQTNLILFLQALELQKFISEEEGGGITQFFNLLIENLVLTFNMPT